MGIKERVHSLINELPHVEIVAASKDRAVSDIMQAIEAGIRIIGENYVQEAEKKHKEIGKIAKLHLIGNLQKNKVKKAVRIFDMIQTVDSESIAKSISEESAKLGKVMPVLIEVNIACEASKSGCLPDEVETLASSINKLPNVLLKGIMCMPSEPVHFALAKKIFDLLSRNCPHVSILSMGMTDSYALAVREGANMVRIGRGIFNN